jgi:hypothetical protein
MTARRHAPATVLALVVLLLAPPAGAQVDRSAAGPPISLEVDLRGRLESDVNSRREDGVRRDDRHRARVRARLELRARPSRSFLLLARVRTGSPHSQQSPHLTVVNLSGGSADRLTGVADRFLVQHTAGRFESWAGRNEFPFWTQNELFWDRDVTLPGGFISYRTPLETPSLQLRAGYFGLPDGAVNVRGRMAAGQVFAAAPLSRVWSLKGAVAVFDLSGAGRTRHLLSGNGQRDYRIATASVQVAWASRGAPIGQIGVGADLLRNLHFERSDADPAVLAYRRARTGVALMTTVGGRTRSGERGAWEIGHTFARMEKLAVNASYAQDDWVRWGSATQTDSSNLRGHEVSGRYWFSPRVDCHARAFFVKSLTTPQDGRRLRVDLNWRFAFTP